MTDFSNYIHDSRITIISIALVPAAITLTAATTTTTTTTTRTLVGAAAPDAGHRATND